MVDVQIKIKGLLEILTEAQDHLKNRDAIGKNLLEQPGFIQNLEDIGGSVFKLQHQCDKYNNSNVVKKKFIVDDTRKKVISEGQQINIMLLQMQSLYVQPPQMTSEINETYGKITQSIMESLSSF